MFRRCLRMSLSLRYKSFCFGILFTSLTWIIALYLYVSLSPSGSDISTHSTSNTPPVAQFRPWFIATSAATTKKNKLSFYMNKVLDVNNLIDEDEESNHINPIPAEKSLMKDRSKITQEKAKQSSRKPVLTGIDGLGLIRSPEDQKIREEGYKKFAFNVLVSNRLSYHRGIPDVRHHLCKEQVYPKNLPTASIIVCFYNEAISSLLRTIYSVLDRTPPEVLNEIILINDFSDASGLIEELTDHLKNVSSKVMMYHTQKREGLIRARTFGARLAKGEVLVFLDSHCEVNRHWLEPLLLQIFKNRTNVVCPIIDIINMDTFSYSASPLVRGGFNWGLHFKWDSIPPNTFINKEDYIKPIMSPTMAGGLFAIDRSYFIALGEYDQGMDIWGGENLEISFRIWMCGGRLEIVPCSRVGHVFRKHRPYGSPSGEDTLLRNSLRVAHVWLDEYKEYYFQTRPDALHHAYGNITDRIELRSKLGCKSFDWYLKNVYPELKLPIPNEERVKMKSPSFYHKDGSIVSKKKLHKTISQHQIQLSGTNLCLESEEDVTSKGSLLIVKRCRKIKSQAWFRTLKQEFILADVLCLDAGEQYPHLAKCHEMGGPQEWKYTSKVNAALYNLAAGQCLGVKNKDEGDFVVLEICTRSGPTSWDILDWNRSD